jgi:hypothetical protein
VLDDPAAFRALGDAARASVEEKYSLDVAVPELKEFFERAASRPGLAMPAARECVHA